VSMMRTPATPLYSIHSITKREEQATSEEAIA
jgi:hypothetical protein